MTRGASVVRSTHAQMHRGSLCLHRGVCPGLWSSSQGVPGCSVTGEQGAGCPPWGDMAPAASTALDFAPRLFSIACNHPTQQKRSPGRGAGLGGAQGGGPRWLPPASHPAPHLVPRGGDTQVGVQLGTGGLRPGRTHHTSHRRRRATSRFCLSVCLSRPPQHGRDSSSDGSWSDTVGSAGCWVPAIPGVSAGADGDAHGRDPT